MLVFSKAALALAAALTAASFCPAPGPAVRQRLAAAHLVLVPPAGWVETPVIDNEWVPYDYALRYPGRRLEVRYVLEPLANVLADTVEHQRLERLAKTRPNIRYERSFQSTKLHAMLGDPTRPQVRATTQAELARSVQALPAALVRTTFKADWGALTALKPSAAFGQTYKRCVLVGLHRHNAAAAYVYYLFDRQQDFAELVMNDPKKLVFHSLRFQ